MATYTLTGTGVQPINPGVGALRCTVTVDPAIFGEGRANPPNWYDVGLLRPMSDIYAWRAIPIDGQDFTFGWPADGDHLGYALFNGTHLTVNEVFGTNPFAGPTGPTGPTGSTGATGAAGPGVPTGGTTGQVLEKNSSTDYDTSWQTPSGGGGSLTYAQAFLASDVTITTANTFYDAASVSLAAGTWLLIGNVRFSDTSGRGDCTARIWDGSTTYVEGEGENSDANFEVGIPLSVVQVLSTTTTVKLSATSHNGTTGRIKADPAHNSAATHTATGLVAVKIA